MSGLIFFNQYIVNVKAQVLPIIVNVAHLGFGNTFPGENLNQNFTVSLVEGYTGDPVNYNIIQKIKPLPNAVVPPEYQGSISDYCQANPTDYDRCYRNLCPFLTKTSDNPQDTEANSTLTALNNVIDNWTVNLKVPAIYGFIAQDNTYGFVDQSGDYGCDISINLEDGALCSISGYKFDDLDKNQNKDTNDPGLANWTINLDWSTVCDPGQEWADHVISSSQGKKKDGSPVDANRSNPLAALGAAENDTNPIHFFSLGFGGQIVLGFDNYIMNGSGNDLQIYEATNEPYPDETVQVYASQDGIAWSDLGNYSKDALVDLGSLPWAKFIKIVDTTNPALHTSTADGYDLDGIKALHCENKNSSSTTTNNSGFYCFHGLSSGQYTVSEVMQDGWLNSTATSTIVNYQGTSQTNINFGNYQPGQGGGGGGTETTIVEDGGGGGGGTTGGGGGITGNGTPGGNGITGFVEGAATTSPENASSSISGLPLGEGQVEGASTNKPQGEVLGATGFSLSEFLALLALAIILFIAIVLLKRKSKPSLN